MKNIFESFFRTITISKDLTQTTDIPPSKTTEFSQTIPDLFLNNIITSRAKAEEERTTNEYIKIYREMSEDPEIENCLDEISNEVLVVKENEEAQVDLDLNSCDSYSKKIKNMLIKEFDEILKLLKFKQKSHEIFKDWYVDGVLKFELVFEKSSLNKGIIKINWLDPINLEKRKKKLNEHDKNSETKEVYIYKIGQYEMEVDPSYIIELNSGYKPKRIGYETSYLHKAIKALNNLKNIEDAIIIYRLTTSAEKKVFNVDTGGLPPTKANSYVANLISKFGNKIVYDQENGTIKGEKNIMSLVENYWFPKTSDGKGTSVDVLQGAQNLNELDDLYYFINKLWKAMGVPKTRRDSNGDNNSIFELGRTTQITRDEMIFYKQIIKLRRKFAEFFIELLKRQAIAKNIMSYEDFDKERENIKIVYNSENYFSEIKESEIFKSRLETLVAAEPYIGKFFTVDQMAYMILKYTEDEWKKIQEELKELKNANYQQSNSGFNNNEPPPEPETPEDQPPEDTKNKEEENILT